MALLAVVGQAHAVSGPGPWGNGGTVSTKTASGGTFSITHPPGGQWSTGSFAGMTITDGLAGARGTVMGNATLHTARTTVTVPARYSLQVTNQALARGVMRVVKGTIPGMLATAAMQLMLDQAELRWKDGRWEKETDEEVDPNFGWYAGTRSSDCLSSPKRACETVRPLDVVGTVVVQLSPTGTSAICALQQPNQWDPRGYSISEYAGAARKDCRPVIETEWELVDETTVETRLRDQIAKAPGNALTDIIANAPGVTIEADPDVETDARRRTGIGPDGYPSPVRIGNGPAPDTITAEDTPEPAPDSDAPPPDTGDGSPSPNGPTITCGLPDAPPCKIDETGTPDGKAERKAAEDGVKSAIDDILAKLPDITKPKPDSPLTIPMPGFPTAPCEPIHMGPWTIEWCWVVPIIHSCMDAFWVIAAFFGCLGLIRQNFTASV